MYVLQILGLAVIHVCVTDPLALIHGHTSELKLPLRNERAIYRGAVERRGLFLPSMCRGSGCQGDSTGTDGVWAVTH